MAYQCGASAGSCVAKPINLGSATDQVTLELFGTGIRGNSGLSGVQVTIGGTALPAAYAGPQSQYPGMDQINVILPRSLAGMGEVNLNVTVNGVSANTVRVAFAAMN